MNQIQLLDILNIVVTQKQRIAKGSVPNSNACPNNHNVGIRPRLEEKPNNNNVVVT